MSAIYKYRGWVIQSNPNHNPHARFSGNCKSWLATPSKDFPIKFEEGITSYWGLAYMRKQIDKYIEIVEEIIKNKKENDNGNG